MRKARYGKPEAFRTGCGEAARPTLETRRDTRPPQQQQVGALQKKQAPLN